MSTLTSSIDYRWRDSFDEDGPWPHLVLSFGKIEICAVGLSEHEKVLLERRVDPAKSDYIDILTASWLEKLWRLRDTL